MKSKFLTPKLINYAFLGTGLYLAYKTYKILYKDDQEKINKQILDKKTVELSKVLNNVSLTYPVDQYTKWSNNLYNLLMYGIGNNYNAVKDILTLMKTNADVSKLYDTYGSREVYVFGTAQGSPRDLLTTLRLELGNNEDGLFTKQILDINNDWLKKKITFKI